MGKVGIIGGSGFIGSHITKLFLDKGLRLKFPQQTFQTKKNMST